MMRRSTLQRLIDALHHSGADLYVEDMLDMFWLATQDRRLSLRAGSQGIPSPPDPIKPGPGAGPALTPAPPVPPPTEDSTEVQEDISDEETPVYADGDAGADGAKIPASPVTVPAGHALPGALKLSRALRPLRQRRPSRHEQELDEVRTVETTAELAGRLFPIFRPLLERWFDVDVVLEDDPAIGLWRDTIRDFCQILSDTGAFRDVRSWRLRMPTPTATSRPYLESASGAQASVRTLIAPGVRRLVFFVTHGVSPRWLDGAYPRLLDPWLRASSVVLLHLLDENHWKRTCLGEPHGVCHSPQPGATAAKLQTHAFWWKIDQEEVRRRLPVPAVSLTAGDLNQWALMQMARGRQCPVFLLDVQISGNPVASVMPPIEVEVAVDLLREASSNAFLLAVYLSSSAFTIPVARLIQEAQFGADARQSDLAEVLLSGLVTSRSAPDTDPNDLYYEFHPKARAILLRSLRDADAESIAAALEQRVSQYIEQIHGRPITFRGLVPDANGKYELPTWAQPFARVGVSLLGAQVRGKTAAQLFKEFRATQPPELVYRAAQLAVMTNPGDALNPDIIEEDLWRAILGARLVRQNHAGKWTFLTGLEPVLKSVASHEPLLGVHIIWVNPDPENIAGEDTMFSALGATLRFVNKDDLSVLAREHFNVVISDARRTTDIIPYHLQLLRQYRISPPIVVYGASGSDAAELTGRGIPAAASLSELRDLTVDAAGRSARAQITDVRKLRVLRLLPSVGIDRARAIRLLAGNPADFAKEIHFPATTYAAIQNHLKIIQVFASSLVNQLVVIEGDVLIVKASQFSPAVAGLDYVIASWDGVIGRAAKYAETLWVPDVKRDPGYIAAEPKTQSELAIPLLGPSGVVGVVNIELDKTDALDRAAIQWLEDFCGPLGSIVTNLTPAPKRTAAASREVPENAGKQPTSAQTVVLTHYAPTAIRPGKWYSAFVFIHWGIAEQQQAQIEQEVRHRLGVHFSGFRKHTSEFQFQVDRPDELTVLSKAPGMEFEFLSQRTVSSFGGFQHEYRLRADPEAGDRPVNVHLSAMLSGIAVTDLVWHLNVTRDLVAKYYISYRRDDSPAVTKLLVGELEDRFGKENVIYDFPSTAQQAQIMSEYIRNSVSACDVLLAVIGPGWLKRVFSASDFVALEISTALEQDLRTIPVLVDTSMPPESDMLPALRELRRRQAVALRTGSDFKRDMAHLMDNLAKMYPTEATPAPERHYRKIFACYAAKDLPVVEQMERYARSLGDQYLRLDRQLQGGEVWDEQVLRLIDEADVFQLFWSRHAAASKLVLREIEYALSLDRPNFVRPVYWEDPLATGDMTDELMRIHFQRISLPMKPPDADVVEPEPAALADQITHLSEKERNSVLAALRHARESGSSLLKAHLSQYFSTTPSNVKVTAGRGSKMISVFETPLADFEADAHLKSYDESNHVFADVLGGIVTPWPIVFFLSKSNPPGVTVDVGTGIVSIVYLGPSYTLADVTGAIDEVLSAQQIHLVRPWFLRFLRKNQVDHTRITTLKSFKSLPSAVESFVLEHRSDLVNRHTIISHDLKKDQNGVDLPAIAQLLGFSDTAFGALDADAGAYFRFIQGDQIDYQFAPPEAVGEKLKNKKLPCILGNPESLFDNWLRLPATTFASIPTVIMVTERKELPALSSAPAFHAFSRLTIESETDARTE